MGAILNEGLYEAYLELCAQVNEAKRAKTTRTSGGKQRKPPEDSDGVPF
jgi:hypothetical protein